MGKRLRELVERLAAEPTPGNREAFHRGLVLSMVWSPVRGGPEATVAGPGGEPVLLVYTDGHSALREPGVRSAGGGPGRRALERALAGGAGLAVTTGHEATAPRATVARDEVPAVLARERVEDAVLGAVTWHPLSDDDAGFWEFDAGPVGKRSVTGVVVPEAVWGPVRAEDWPRIRRTVQWARANDLATRQHIAAEMWDWWYNEYCDPPDREAVRTPEQFRDKLELEVVRFEPGKDAFLDYADHGLVSGYGIRVYVSPDGRFTRGPEVC